MWKPTKKHNSVSYGPYFRMNDTATHYPCLYNFQLSGFHSYQEKSYYFCFTNDK